MATNKVITVTTPSVVTNDTLASYNAYSDQDGALGSLSVAEAAAGKTFALSDGVVHSVTVKPVGTSNGEFSAVISNAVSVDLSNPAGVNALQTSSANQSSFYTTNANTYYANDGDYVEFNIGLSPSNVNVVYLGNDTSSITSTGVLNVRCDTAGSLRAYSGAQTSAEFSVSPGDKLKFQRAVSPDSIQVFVNNSLVTSVEIPDWNNQSKQIVFGARNQGSASSVDQIFYNININGETFGLTEGSGSTATGSSSNTLTLVSNLGSVNDMWTTS